MMGWDGMGLEDKACGKGGREGDKINEKGS